MNTTISGCSDHFQLKQQETNYIHMRRNFAVTIYMLILLFVALQSAAQSMGPLSTKNKRAINSYEKALNHYQLMEIDQAAKLFKQALEHDPDFIESYIVMGEMFQRVNRHHEAVDAFSAAIEMNPDFFPNLLYYASVSCYYSGQYKLSTEYLEQFLTYRNISDKMAESARYQLRLSEYALSLKNNPVPFEPQDLGSNVNTQFAEYAPTLTADEQTLIFTRRQPSSENEFSYSGDQTEDFFISWKEDGQWSPAENLGPPINTNRNEGAPSLSADGRYLYFTACSRPGGRGSCDIYVTERHGDTWSEPVNLGSPVNTTSWESQPSISPDGRTLFFTSNRNSEMGMDIWYSMKLKNGNWSAPMNLGKTINTSGRDMSPFIHPDNKTLFFSSEGHPGMGGLDIYYTRRNIKGQWSEPVNLGYPINTHKDEISLIVSASGKSAFFASSKEDDQDKTDLYYFELYEEARPTPVTYMKGHVFDVTDNERLKAEFELVDLTTGEILAKSSSDEITGEFLIPIPVSTNLGLNVSKKGYLFFSENFSFEKVRSDVDPHLYDIPLQPVRVGESVVLKNIFFETDSHKLKQESISELNRLLSLLNENPEISVEIAGHTDNVGSYDYNKKLSQNRALSVFNYLTENGISDTRLSFKGYADSKPVATNETDEGRAKNRRTEFKVTSFN